MNADIRTFVISRGKNGKAKGMEEVVLIGRLNWDKDANGRYIHAGWSTTAHRPVQKDASE